MTYSKIVLLGLVSLFIGHVTGQATTSLITTVQGGQTFVITEVESTVGQQGPTQIIQIEEAFNGMTITQTLELSPTEVKRIQDVDLPGEVEHEVLDCKIDPNGLGHCIQTLSASVNGVVTQTAVTFESQFLPPSSATPPPTSAPSQSPSPTSSSKSSASSSSSAQSAAGGSISASASNSPSSSSTSSTSSSSSSSTPSSSSSSTSSASFSTNGTATPSAVTPSATPANSTDSATDGPATVTSPGPISTNGTLNPTDASGAMMNTRSLSTIAALAFLGSLHGLM